MTIYRDVLFKNIVNNELEFPRREEDEPPLSEDSVDLVRRLLEKNPCKRLGFMGGIKDIKKHAFFKSVDWDRLQAK